MPTSFDLFNCYSSLVKGKACGEGFLVSGVFKSFPYHRSKLVYPLVVKTAVRIQTPLQWKGGMIVTALKTKDPPPLSHRIATSC